MDKNIPAVLKVQVSELMRSSPYGLFILVDYPPTSNLQVFLNITIYIKPLISLEILEAEFFVVSLLPMLWSRKLVSKSVNLRFLR